MTYAYDYELVDGHIVVNVSGLRLLIDTGAPFSVSDSSPLLLASGSYPMQKHYMGVTTESLSKSIGTSMSALVGADILNEYDILIDPMTHSFSMNEDDFPLDGTLLELDDFMGIPIIEANVGQDTVRMFFDTGAKLSYLDPDKTMGLRSVGTERDFYPGIGDFNTHVYDVPIILSTENIILRVGNLPELLQMTLMMANTSGILGSAILRTHKITFAPRRKKIALHRIV